MRMGRRVRSSVASGPALEETQQDVERIHGVRSP
jgi:hypothetical protein